MKRSDINRILANAAGWLQALPLELPTFFWWQASRWDWQDENARAAARSGFGWDVTDFGSGEFHKNGLVLLSLSSGVYGLLEDGQFMPLHFHREKTQQISPIAGGALAVQLFPSTAGGELGLLEEVAVSVNDAPVELSPGATLDLHCGDRIAIPPRIYHACWGEGRVLFRLNPLSGQEDGHSHFYETIRRFPAIDEDEPPNYLLVRDYPSDLVPVNRL